MLNLMILEEIIQNKIMNTERIKCLAVDNADKKIKEVNKNELSAIADYDRGLIEGYIDGYNEAIKDIIKSIVNDYTEVKRQLLKEKIIAINTEEALNSGKVIKLDNNVIFRINAQCCDVGNKNNR